MMRLHSSQQRLKALHINHPLNCLTDRPPPPRYMKQTTFNNNNDYTINRQLDDPDEDSIKTGLKDNHRTIVQTYLDNRPDNKLLNGPTPDIDKTEETLDRRTRRTLAQLRTNKSPLLMTYRHKIDPDNFPSDLCPLCRRQPHDTGHLFDCTEIPTRLTIRDLWQNPVAVSGLLLEWEEKLGR